MKVTINVTREDIDEGFRRNAYQCPLARAVGRAFPNPHYEIEVDESILIKGEGREYRIRANEILYDIITVAKFQSRFDNEDFVSPFTKEVEAEEIFRADYEEE